MTTGHQRLTDLHACGDAQKWAAGYPTAEDAWADCDRADWMLWLATRVLDRRRAVGVLVEVVRATCAHLADDAVTTDVLNPLAAWSHGDASVNPATVMGRAWELWRIATDAAATATADAAADAAADANAAYAAAAAANAANAAYATATTAAADAAADAATSRLDVLAAMADVVRAHLGADEIEAALMGGG